MAKIHPTAVVMPGAKLADDVEIGPLCYVGENVEIGSGSRLIAQCHVNGHTTLGSGNVLYPFAALGLEAQDHAVEPGSKTYLKIGDNNIFREGVAIHTGTKPDTETVIGSGCMFMNHSHVAHNCVVGNNVIMVNGSVIGGYSQLGDGAILSGLCAVHQFCRVGRLAIISGVSAFSKDVPPFMMAEGRNGSCKMVNLVGLKRAGFDAKTIRALKDVFKICYHENLGITNALAKIKAEIEPLPEVLEFIEFCENSPRGVVGGHVAGHRD